MAWKDEIRPAVYTSPSGSVFEFVYGSLSRETDLKTATFTFPEADGALVTPLGVGGRRFPLTCTFFGDNCFSEADAFELGLQERGYGQLQHPVYGDVKVVPTGTIKRDDNLVSGANQSIVSITFAETIIDETFPTSQILLEDEIKNDVLAFEDAAIAEYANDMAPSNVSAAIFAQNNFKASSTQIVDGLSDVAKKSQSAYNIFVQQALALEDAIDNFSQDVVDVAVGVLQVVRTPARLAVDILAKVEGYATIIDNLLFENEKPIPGVENVKNQFINTKLALESLIVNMASGIALASTGSGAIDAPEGSVSGGTSYGSNAASFSSRGNAVDTAVSMMELYDRVLAFFDAKIAQNLFVDTGGAYSAMQNVFVKSIKIIIDYSFNLQTQKIIVLGRDRNVIEFLYEVYGSLDRLDEFIVDNNLTYNEIEIMPMGREVKIYA